MFKVIIILFIVAMILLVVAAIKGNRSNHDRLYNRMESILNKQESDANPKTTSSRDSILVTTEKEALDPPKQEKTEAVRYIPPEKLELTDAVVPEGQVFSEAMDLLLYLARTYPETFVFRLYVPVSASEVTAFEERNGIEMTEELRSLYQFTNGFTWNCGYIHLMELDQVEKHLKNVYEWGDTKHYAYLGERVGDGEGIYFDLDFRKIITNFHGEETEYACLTDILNKIIDEFLDCEVEDDRLDAYLQKLRAPQDA